MELAIILMLVTDVRLCHWDTPACFFFTRSKMECARYIEQNIAECTQITWIPNKALPSETVSSLHYNISPANWGGSMTFEYQYFNCSGNEFLFSSTSFITNISIIHPVSRQYNSAGLNSR